jgi:hypothetical protein
MRTTAGGQIPLSSLLAIGAEVAIFLSTGHSALGALLDCSQAER